MKSLNSEQIEELISLESAVLNSKKYIVDIHEKLTDIYSVNLTRLWWNFSTQTKTHSKNISYSKSSQLQL